MRRGELGVFAVTLVALSTWGCGGGTPASPPAPAPAKEVSRTGRVTLPSDSPRLKQIRVVEVEAREMPEDVVTAPGKVEVNPNRVSRVLMPVSGRIRAVLVRLGDSVEEGQALVTVESQEAAVALSSYRQVRARYRQRRSAHSKAERDLARLKALYERRAAALKDLANAENELNQAEGEVQGSQAEMEEAQKRLEVLGLDPDGTAQDIIVRAPIAGKVVEIGVAPGEFRTDTTASLMTIADLSTVWVTSNVPEGSIRLVQVGEPVEIVLVAYPHETFRGRVTRIADAVDAATRTVKVHAELANPNGRFLPGMFGNIFHSHGSRRVVVVPAGAVVQTGQGAIVYREVERGTFERIRVTTESPLNGVVPVLSGLRPGERVVAEGAVLLGSH
ncbi:MAG: efflux RND transporter periplasmic adaptor subunit [Bryobacteraceae bacterium]